MFLIEDMPAHLILEGRDQFLISCSSFLVEITVIDDVYYCSNEDDFDYIAKWGEGMGFYFVQSRPHKREWEGSQSTSFYFS